MAVLTSHETGDDAQVAQYSDIRIGQTFTLASDATVSDLEVLIFRSGSPGTVSVSLYTTVDQGGGEIVPDSFIRAVEFNGDTLTTSSTGEWKQIILTGGESLSAGTYAIVISGGDDVSNNIQWRVDSGDPFIATYAGGTRCSSHDAGVTWSASFGLENHDFLFRVNGAETYIFSPPAGGPTTKRLIAAAASALWYEDL